ncbi:putative non-specific serine/threonine protein kinase [Helianthus annuus]|nr:putative non-specific serine/threonine protein kinase [Helianthus annuus]KAJ0564345.1 putative non-specific serine/threonine protein kinase [Helianthus annuus]KAJ0732411.1 putative non-specific serine/threonine protein kinase [Helianthus annuus]KAJ0906039.1 putative non-specific serine/threonine protein kinase [Helianthus annuus]
MIPIRRTGGGDGGDRSDGSEYLSEDEGTEDCRHGGYHAVRVGDVFKHSRYVVHRKLGWGAAKIAVRAVKLKRRRLHAL